MRWDVFGAGFAVTLVIGVAYVIGYARGFKYALKRAGEMNREVLREVFNPYTRKG